MNNHKKNKIIPLSEPVLNGNEIKYLTKCIEDSWISTAGKFVDEFENKIKYFTKAKFATSFINGTSALHLGLKILDVKKGDEVIAPTITFVSPINTIIYNLCSPIFMDSDEFFNIDVEKTIDFIKKETYYQKGFTFNKKTKKRIKVLLVVHVFGNAVNLYELINICKKRNIKIIEDASESLGSIYKKSYLKNKHTGLIGDVGCLSFNGNKIISSGSGGMLVTNNKEYYKRAKYLSNQAKDDPIYFVHNEIGYNYKLNNLCAAVGLAQLETLKKKIKIKKKINSFYQKNIDKLNGFYINPTPNYCESNYWLNILRINQKNINLDFKDIINYFRKNYIDARAVWHPNHLQRKFLKFQKYKIENAKKIVETSVCLPSSVNLGYKDQEKVVSLLKNLKS